jgi:hypothetical protein
MVFNRHSKAGELGQKNTIQHSTVQYSTVQYSTVQYSTVQYSTVQYSTKSYGTVRLYRGQNPCYILPRSKIQILLRTVWEETRGAQRPESPPKQSSVKFGFCSEVKYKLNSTRPLGRDTVQGAYNEPLWGELYVTWILAPVQS